MVELFNYKKSADFFMKCLFTEVHQFYFPRKCDQNAVLFKYYYITDLYMYISHHKFSKNCDLFSK